MPAENSKIAVYWDESYLWGLIAYRTFTSLGISFELLSAREIGAGRLDEGFDVIFVPGGWASDKITVLGESGKAAIKDFVWRGGGYLGFCGGAGLALSHESGLGLAPFGRLPTSERLPSFSGRIGLITEEPEHAMWRGVEPGAAFYAWWPGQFELGAEVGGRVLATYSEPQPGSFVTDLPCDAGLDWRAWESSYGINLDPARIVGAPAVVEVAYGSGKVILSYLHFETPDDAAGHRVLLNLIGYLSGKRDAEGAVVVAPAEVADTYNGANYGRAESVGGGGVDERADSRGGSVDFYTGLSDGGVGDGGTNSVSGSAGEPPNDILCDDSDLTVKGLSPEAGLTRAMVSIVNDFIEFGSMNFLWYWRNDWLLQWRRGVRGIEYSTLSGMLAEIDRLVGNLSARGADEIFRELSELEPVVREFFGLARELILKERYAMNFGPVSPLKSDEPDILRLREELFSRRRRCGGLYREILSRADTVLLSLLRREME